MRMRDRACGAVVGVSVALAEVLTASAVLRSSGKLLDLLGEDRAAEIFSSLDGAGIRGSVVVFVLSALAVGLAVSALLAGKKRALCVSLVVVSCVLGSIGTLLCLRVNGVPVYTAVGVVLDIAASGLL